MVLEKDNLELNQQEIEKSNLIQQERINDLEMEMFQLKAKLGEIVNSVMEIGDDELLDTLESILVAEDIEYYRKSKLKE